MKRLIFLLMLSGCAVENPVAIEIIGNLIPMNDDTGCSIQVGGMQTRTQGLLDLFLFSLLPDAASGYEGYISMKSALKPTSDPNRNLIQVTGADIQVRQLPKALDPKVPTSGHMTSLGGQLDSTTMSLALTVNLLPRSLAAALAADLALDLTNPILIDFRITGTMQGDSGKTTVSSPYATFPLKLCRGCLIGADQFENIPACDLPKGTIVNSGHPCNIAQDVPITCCRSGSAIKCGKSAPVATM